MGVDPIYATMCFLTRFERQANGIFLSSGLRDDIEYESLTRHSAFGIPYPVIESVFRLKAKIGWLEWSLKHKLKPFVYSVEGCVFAVQSDRNRVGKCISSACFTELSLWDGESEKVELIVCDSLASALTESKLTQLFRDLSSFNP